ncbi:type II CAAX endopeptidase family protein [Paenibacillus alvei]|uniref:type II CAAX endopeptidase family protein n=1 Tax=Paenibacillus alvei TaxID=44250 RepID=UPI0013D9B13D|nr:type II CAAX endopeptidase family protein [Paenibacillus alvei]MBG9736777.1 hypothetical protein [Paenibacillus alvei]MBG9746933.1 hypothetical protein [Paenibacillus alvei]MCY9581955.1 CPBP family intramembrane metalloprotease [Paenibacillus alvei]MCY9585853.1 CPBP family intramembrane metalloprotease [Paenibacillus alvei]NEZ43575.1 CPBP family intramembrane metalloprotease [Paenibacillus alvei]
MFSNLKNQTKAISYTAITFILAVCSAMVPDTNSLVYMLTPAAAVLIMLLLVTKDGYSRSGWAALGLGKSGHKWWWIICLILPSAIVALSYGLALGIGVLVIDVPPTYEGYSWTSFPIVVALQFVGAVFTSSLGEEIGWRGYLLPLLVDSLGERKALVISGLIHGLWHIPIIMLSPIYHHDQNPMLACLFIIMSCVFLGPVIGFIRLRTSSVWTSSAFHSAHNVTWAVLRGITVPTSSLALYIAGDNSIIVICCYMLLTIWIIKRIRNHSCVR